MRPPAMLTGVRTRRVRPTTPENTGSKVGTGKDDLRHQRLVSGGARRDPTVHPGVRASRGNNAPGGYTSALAWLSLAGEGVWS